MDAIKEAMIREEDTGIRNPQLDNYRDAINFVTDGTIERVCSRPTHREEVLRECFKHKLARCENEVEALTDYCRDMVRAKIDTSAELNEAETFIRALLLVVLLLKREHSGEA